MNNIAKIKRRVENIFKNFGVNKQRETVRLLYEICKREGTGYRDILPSIKEGEYSKVKKTLIKRRYPNAHMKGRALKLYLPQLEIYPGGELKIEKKFKLYPSNVFIEDAVSNSYIVSRFREHFPKASFKRIDSLKDYVRGRAFTIKDYNSRRDNFFIVREKYDFFKDCPCTSKAIFCGYNIFNLGLGCIYDCSYCYLQEYLKNSPGIIIPANLKDFFSRFNARSGIKSGIFNQPRVGNGEFADSLALDGITEFSGQIIEFFRKKPHIFFEFKTKSNNIENILKTKPVSNIAVSWSLNPQKIIDENEFYTASLAQRISAAKECANAGLKVGFHFDPIIYYPHWEIDYENLINNLFDKIPDKSIAWISLGTLRFNPSLKKTIENRFPENKILDAELTLGFDKKLRYYQDLRIIIYKKMKDWIRKRAGNIPIYLCMEEREVWKEFNGPQ